MTIIPLEVQVDVSIDDAYDVQILQDEVFDMDLGTEIAIHPYTYIAGNGITIQNETISIDSSLIIDCGTSTTVLHGGVT